MLNFFAKISKKYNNLVEIRLSKGNLQHNLHTFQNLYDKVLIAPVLKSNAYGHGLIQVAEILDHEDIPFMVVDSYFEALLLRKNKIKTPILIIGYTLLDNLTYRRLKDVSYAITSLQQLRLLSQKLKQPVTIHLKINTGMNRQGINIDEVDEALKIIDNHKFLNLEGIFSHLANADDASHQQNAKQIKLWNDLIDKIKLQKRFIKYIHFAASAGIKFSSNVRANIARIGLGLYGVEQNNDQYNLKPVLAMYTYLTRVAHLFPDASVGYGGTYQAEQPVTIGTIPVGYYEGLDIGLSNRGMVKIRDKFCPIVGKISMNITTIDISKLGDLNFEEQVEVISCRFEDTNSVTKMAVLANKIPYEILVHIPERLKRIIVE